MVFLNFDSYFHNLWQKVNQFELCTVTVGDFSSRKRQSSVCEPILWFADVHLRRLNIYQPSVKDCQGGGDLYNDKQIWTSDKTRLINPLLNRENVDLRTFWFTLNFKIFDQIYSV